MEAAVGVAVSLAVPLRMIVLLLHVCTGVGAIFVVVMA